MLTNRIATTLCLVLICSALGACVDDPPTAPEEPLAVLDRDDDSDSDGDSDGDSDDGKLGKYVAIGTSVSMGVQSDGVFSFSQASSWPAQLARFDGQELTQPYISGFGCGAPLAPPLASGVRISGEGAAAPGDTRTCAPLEPGITLPAGNVAVDGARTIEALTRTPVADPVTLRDRQYARVLPPGETQVSAMMQQDPDFVSVELGANELLGARSGVYLPGVTVVPVSVWKPQYVQVLDAVEKVTDEAILVGLVRDAMDFPSFRTGAELWEARATFAPLNVQVSEDCGTSNASNVLFVAVRVPDAAARGAAMARAGAGPFVLSCQNAPSSTGTQDFVLTSGEIAALNAQLNEMNDFIRQQARKRDFAYFELGALYGKVNVKAAFNAVTLMTSPEPYGPYISLDGFHPSALGSKVLAEAAARALNRQYDMELRMGPSAQLVANR